MTTQPISLDIIESEFSEHDCAWVLQDLVSREYVTIPDPNHPGRRPIRFFLSESDAKHLLRQVTKASKHLQGKRIRPVKVNLKTALRGIYIYKHDTFADSFVLHSPNEVFEFMRDRA